MKGATATYLLEPCFRDLVDGTLLLLIGIDHLTSNQSIHPGFGLRTISSGTRSISFSNYYEGSMLQEQWRRTFHQRVVSPQRSHSLYHMT